MGKGEEAMCSEYRMCQSKWVLSVHLGAANHAGQMMVKVVFIIFHLKVCDVYKAMNHAVLSWGRTVPWQTQLPKVISERLKHCTCVSQVLWRVQISLRKISSNFPFSLSHKLPSHPTAILTPCFFSEPFPLPPVWAVFIFLSPPSLALYHHWLSYVFLSSYHLTDTALCSFSDDSPLPMPKALLSFHISSQKMKKGKKQHKVRIFFSGLKRLLNK